MWRHVASNGLTVIGLLMVFAVGLAGWGDKEFRSEGPLGAASFFEVPQGASLRTVSQKLEEEGIITSAAIFRIGAQYTGGADALKFGGYDIPSSASMEDVLDIITKGGRSVNQYLVNFIVGDGVGTTRLLERDPATGRNAEVVRFASDAEAPQAYTDFRATDATAVFRVTVPEGRTSWQVVEALKGADFLEGDIPVVPAEGSLAPDSYDVDPGSPRSAVLERMAVAQERLIETAWAARQEGLPLANIDEALILASIVERETGVAGERPQVASVFINRLRQGMRLQTDPTVIYGITLGKGGLGRGLRRSELDGKTPYNTYQIDGLPPTPIANPGRAAIEATLNPDDTEFLFFVADGTGGHAFATNLNDHNANVRRWRQIERERADN